MAYKQGSSGSGSTFAPGTTIQLFDDFINAFIPTTGETGVVKSSMVWLNTNSTLRPINATESGHPGILNSESITSDRSFTSPGDGSVTTGLPIILGGGAISLCWVFKINTLSDGTNRYILNAGIQNAANPSNGVYFSYSDNVNTGKWTITAETGGTPTTTNTNTTVTTGWHTLKIDINAAGSSAEFFMDSVSQGTIASGFPTTALAPNFGIDYVAGTIPASSFLIDLFWMTQTLTTPR